MTVTTLEATNTENRKAVVAGTIGNVLEWYDFGVYGYLPTTKAHVRAAIVEREDTTFVVDNEYRSMRPVHHQPPLSLQLLEAARAHKIRGRYVHQQFLSAIVFC